MEIVEASTVQEWRDWLERNSQTLTEVWLVIRHKNSGIPSVRYDEAVEHALCYGWIDSSTRKHDATSSVQRFSPRRPRSKWSTSNVERAERMIRLGLMTPHGQATIDHAKAVGTWPADT